MVFFFGWSHARRQAVERTLNINSLSTVNTETKNFPLLLFHGHLRIQSVSPQGPLLRLLQPLDSYHDCPGVEILLEVPRMYRKSGLNSGSGRREYLDDGRRTGSH